VRGLPALQVRAGLPGDRPEGGQLAAAGQSARPPGVFRRASGEQAHNRFLRMTSPVHMYSHAQSRDSQYQLIERYAPLVKRIAYHLLGRLPASVQVEDLMQAGMIGLLEAAKKYDSGK